MSETRSGRSTLTTLCNMLMTRLLAAETINVPFTAKKVGGGGVSLEIEASEGGTIDANGTQITVGTMDAGGTQIAVGTSQNIENNSIVEHTAERNDGFAVFAYCDSSNI